ncbi:MAG: hypothetical protein J6W64_02460 [Bacilli bacterium]|nr:hypothetical protein [Bacilli bacterium]
MICPFNNRKLCESPCNKCAIKKSCKKNWKCMGCNHEDLKYTKDCYKELLYEVDDNE